MTDAEGGLVNSDASTQLATAGQEAYPQTRSLGLKLVFMAMGVLEIQLAATA